VTNLSNPSITHLTLPGQSATYHEQIKQTEEEELSDKLIQTEFFQSSSDFFPQQLKNYTNTYVEGGALTNHNHSFRQRLSSEALE
jgi:hypothetical protein